jgi:nucleoside-diphosphate-sugar epimerase
MLAQQTVLVVGGTGRTGGRVVGQLLDRGVNVVAIVRSAVRLPAGVAGHPGLTVVEADLLSLTDEDLAQHVQGCDAVISCLGHVINLRGIFGPPRDLVTRATSRLCRAIEASKPGEPVKFILMSSVSVDHPGNLDPRRGVLEKVAMWLLSVAIPPTKDNQRAADFLHSDIGTDNAFLQWVAVRPDTLREGDKTDYSLHEFLVSSLFKPDNTNMSNVAHFMCELATNPDTWGDWVGELPVIINPASADSRGGRP